MKFFTYISLSLFDVDSYILSLSLGVEETEKYEALLISENIMYDIDKRPYNSHPTDFTKKHIDNASQYVNETIKKNYLNDFKGYNVKILTQDLFRPSEHRYCFFPTLEGFRQEVKIYVTFGSKESLNHFKIKNPKTYKDLIPISGRG